jgi:endonuclease/exonuclease/phosphatase family metal-dependent hydrolase
MSDMRAAALLIAAMMLSIFRLTGYFNEPRLTDAEIHAIAGEPGGVSASVAAPASAAASNGTRTIVSWNIERGVQFDRILATLRTLNPDIILLQEADRYCRRSGNRDVPRDLAQALDMHWVSAGEFQEIGEAADDRPAITGQAILSREPITDPAVIRFTRQSWRWRWSPTQPRRGGRIALRARTAGLDIVNVHLESQSDDGLRRQQLDEALPHVVDATHAVVAGDFNNAAMRLEPAGLIDALGPMSEKRQTSINHLHPIDWIFVKGVTAHAGRVERIEAASDHYPLVASITVPVSAPGGTLTPRGHVAGLGAGR